VACIFSLFYEAYFLGLFTFFLTNNNQSHLSDKMST